MKKRPVIVVMVLTVAIVLMGQLGFAQEKKFAVGMRVSNHSYQGGDIELFTDMDTDYEDAVGLSVNGTYFFGKSFSLELGVGRQETTMKFSAGSNDGDYGELSQTLVLLTGRYHFTPSDKITIYAGLGIGYYLNDMENSDSPGDFFLVHLPVSKLLPMTALDIT